MIICSCNVISDREIKSAVEEIVAGDPDAVLTPGMVYRALNCRPKCGTCLQQVVELIHEHRESLLDEGGAPGVRDNPRGKMDKTPESV